MRDYREYVVWQKSHAMALAVYRTIEVLPKTEQYGLSSQMRRAAASVPSNIAEGCGRGGDAELARFCRIALGSASELDYQVLLAHDLHMFTEDSYDELHRLIAEVRRMLAALIRRLDGDVRAAKAAR